MVELPPLLLYALGGFLIVAGIGRGYFLGWAKRGQTAPDDEGAPRPGRGQAYTPQKQLRWGFIWVALGLFIVVSTWMRARGR